MQKYAKPGCILKQNISIHRSQDTIIIQHPTTHIVTLQCVSVSFGISFYNFLGRSLSVGLGVYLERSRKVASPRSCLAVGFPLPSLTHTPIKYMVMEQGSFSLARPHFGKCPLYILCETHRLSRGAMYF